MHNIKFLIYKFYGICLKNDYTKTKSRTSKCDELKVDVMKLFANVMNFYAKIMNSRLLLL